MPNLSRMPKDAREHKPSPDEALEEALALVTEEIRAIYSKRQFGRVEVHMDRRGIALIRTVRDRKIEY